MILRIISALHRRFPKAFTPSINSLINTALPPPQRVGSTASTMQATTAPSVGDAGVVDDNVIASSTISTLEQKKSKMQLEFHVKDSSCVLLQS